MKTFNEYKNEIVGLFKKSIDFAKESGYNSISDTIVETQQKYVEKELMIIVCGEMRRGKSSLLTAFLEEIGLFPIDINTCTNVISIVRYGETEKIEALLEKLEGEEIIYEQIQIKREDIGKFVTEYGNKNNEKRVSCLNIEIPNEKLKDGFVFVDTPGIGSLNFEHAQVTYGFLPNADLLLFVSDVLSPLTDSELKFLEESYKHCKNILFPLTKSDESTEEEIKTIIQSNILKISKTLNISEDEINLIPVSNDEKLLYLKDKKEECLKNSNFKHLESLVWKTIYDNRAQIVILPFLLQLLEEVQKIKGNINLQQEALAQDINKANELVEELKKKKQHITKLKNDGGQWQKDIQYKLNVVSQDVGLYITEATSNITENIEVLLNQNGAHNKLNEISCEANNLLSALVIDVKNQISESTIAINNDISEDLGLFLDFNESVLNSVGFDRKETISYNKPQVSAVDSMINGGRVIAGKSFGGGMAGSIIGGAIGGLVGLLGGPVGVAAGIAWGASIGSLGGGAKGVWDVITDPNAKDIPSIKQAFNRYLNQSLSKIQRSLNKCILELNKALLDGLTKQLNDQISEFTTLITQIENNLRLTEKEVHQRKTVLQMQMKSAEKIEKEIIMASDEMQNVEELVL